MYNYPYYIEIPYVQQEGREKSWKLLFVKNGKNSKYFSLEVTGTGVTLFHFLTFK